MTQPDGDQCSSDKLEACDDEVSCTNAGGQWDGQACQPPDSQNPDPDPDPDPDPSIVLTLAAMGLFQEPGFMIVNGEKYGI